MSCTIELPELGQFTGTETYYSHQIFGNKLYYTDGIHYLATNGAAWLVDEITLYQKNAKLQTPALQEFQIWTLDVAGASGVLRCREDSDIPPVIEKEITYTDFPPGQLKLFVELGSIDGVNPAKVLYLPSER